MNSKKIQPSSLFNTLLPIAEKDFELDENMLYNPPDTNVLHQLPRKKAFYSDWIYKDDGDELFYLYRYGNRNSKGDFYDPIPHPFPPQLDRVRQIVAPAFDGLLPNHCVDNFYEDGSKYIGFHDDKVESLVPDTGVATISLYGKDEPIVRYMELTPKNVENPSKPVEKYRIPMINGSLFFLGPKWLHSIVEEEKPVDPRLSLTFRVIKWTISNNTGTVFKNESSVKRKSESSQKLIPSKNAKPSPEFKSLSIAVIKSIKKEFKDEPDVDIGADKIKGNHIKFNALQPKL